MQVLLDINVLLDGFLDRTPWATDAVAIFNAQAEGKIEAFVSAASLPTVFYLVRQSFGIHGAKAAICECLNLFSILTVDQATAEAAFALPGSDFEDNLQIACAVQAGLDLIITRDPRGFAASPIPAVAPADLLALIARTP